MRSALPANYVGCPEPIAGSTRQQGLVPQKRSSPPSLGTPREQTMTVHAGMLVHSVTTVEQALTALALLPATDATRRVGGQSS